MKFVWPFFGSDKDRRMAVISAQIDITSLHQQLIQACRATIVRKNHVAADDTDSLIPPPVEERRCRMILQGDMPLPQAQAC
jgi:hypothetical protein